MFGRGVPLPRVPEHLRAAEASPEGHADLSGVVIKLAIFTVAMVLMPIGTYYLTRDYLFAPTTSLTYPAICAVTVANLVLVGFIWIAFREDMADSARDDQQRKQREREKQALLSKESVVSGRATGVAAGQAGEAKADSGTTTSRSRRRD
ncbi:hypothetical protein JCM10908_000583 [Rhodotorula pacifica]|uniref:Vma21p n=1 Tax=Rhodotorula pacifica TaxID=1495444 RepID=UPI00317CED7D